MRLNDLIGKPIVSADDGAKLGSVEDLLLDETGHQLVGVLVGHGMLGKQQVLPFAEIRTPGSDALIARSASRLLDAKVWQQQGAHAIRASLMRGKEVVTANGDRVGTVDAVIADDATGAIVALDVAAKALGGLRTRRTTVRVTADAGLSSEVIVVPNAVMAQLGEDEEEPNAT